MLSDNGLRLDIWLSLKNKFDYSEFSEMCAQQNVAPQPVFEFAQKAGMLSCALLLYPKLPASEAYLRLIEEHQQEMIAAHYTAPPTISERSQQTTAVSTSKCSSCGGGKVR